MRYNKIRKMDIADGPGVRVSVFLQGCAFHCKGCFNEETWSFKAGKEFNDEVIEQILDLCDNSYIKGLSILGGEPMHPTNIEGTTLLAKKFKERFKDKTIWAWTGFLFDEYLMDKDVVNYIDVIVDGQFVEELKNPNLKWKGSSNQRVIDVKKSMKKGEVVLWED